MLCPTQTNNGIIFSLARTHRCSDPEYYNALYGIIGTVFQSAILLAGVMGNMMVVITVRHSVVTNSKIQRDKKENVLNTEYKVSRK